MTKAELQRALDDLHSEVISAITFHGIHRETLIAALEECIEARRKGMVLVPREPTVKIINAFCGMRFGRISSKDFRMSYDAMISAATKQTGGEDV